MLTLIRYMEVYLTFAPLDNLCTAAPPLKKIGKELLSDFFEGRGGCTQASLWIVFVIMGISLN